MNAGDENADRVYAEQEGVSITTGWFPLDCAGAASSRSAGAAAAAAARRTRGGGATRPRALTR